MKPTPLSNVKIETAPGVARDGDRPIVVSADRRLDGLAFREFTISRRDDGPTVPAESRIVSLALSSETPYRRYDWWTGEEYDEILDHSSKSIRLDRLKNGAAFLLDHNARDQIGAILPDSVKVGADGVLRMDARLSRSAKGQEILDDINDGIRTKVSVGYQIHEYVLEGEKDGIKTFRVTDWEPFEGSLVSIPADDTVGIGRSAMPPATPSRMFEPGGSVPAVHNNPGATAQPTKEIQMDQSIQGGAREATPENNVIEIGKAREEARNDERARVNAIQSAAEKMPRLAQLAQKAIKEGASVDQFGRDALDYLAANASATERLDRIGMSKKQLERFSICRAVASMDPISGNRVDAGFERECSAEVARKLGKEPKGMFIPDDVHRGLAKRDLTAGTATDGAELVGVNTLPSEYIEYLRNSLHIVMLGARILPGLVGDVAIPKQSAGASAAWIATEGADAAQSEPQFATVSLVPKTVGAWSLMTRDLLLQSTPAIDKIVEEDLARAMAQAIDLAAIHGTGASGQPTGIVATAGIGSVAGGTNGLAPAWTHILQLEEKVALANADIGGLAYLTNPKVRRKLKETEKFATSNGDPIWEKVSSYKPHGELNGYQACSTNQVSSTLTKGTSSGVCSAIIFGNFYDLLIGEWGGLDLLVDPYTNSKNGSVVIRVFKSICTAVRREGSFAAMLDALTA